MGKKRKAGYTLVEASIVVAVIGLLSAVGIPSFNAVRARSLNHTRESNVRLLNHAVEMWAMDHLATDGSSIKHSITNYIRGGLEQLDVGSRRVGLSNIVERTVGHTFAVDDLY